MSINRNRKPTQLYDLLVAEATVPVRGLFVLVCVFGIGIGPANLWLLSRYKRRIWLWWNVPVLSLLTCLAVFRLLGGLRRLARDMARRPA